MYPSGCLQVVSSLEYRCGETVTRGVTAWEGGADPQGSNQENTHMYQAQQWGRSLTAVAKLASLTWPTAFVLLV